MHIQIFVPILTLNLTPKALDFSFSSLFFPNFTKKPKKISSNSPGYVVELRQCSPVVVFRAGNYLFMETKPLYPPSQIRGIHEKNARLKPDVLFY